MLHAHHELEHEGGRHGAGGHAAGVEGDAQKVPVREGRQGKYDNVAPQQHPPQVDAVQDAQHAHHHEKSHTYAHRQQQHGLVDVGHGVRQHLQVRLRHRHRHAQCEGHQQYHRQLAYLCQRRTDLVADDGHGALGAQREQPQPHHRSSARR